MDYDARVSLWQPSGRCPRSHLRSSLFAHCRCSGRCRVARYVLVSGEVKNTGGTVAYRPYASCGELEKYSSWHKLFCFEARSLA